MSLINMVSPKLVISRLRPLLTMDSQMLNLQMKVVSSPDVTDGGIGIKEGIINMLGNEIALRN